jgi:hypothetical protein
MSEKDLKKKHHSDAVKTTTATMPGGRKARIRWDDSKIRSHYPKVLNVTTAREEISLSFGGDRTRNTAQDEEGYRLSDRIVMSPFTAKRLVMLLNDVIRTYEAKYGPLEKGRPAL